MTAEKRDSHDASDGRCFDLRTRITGFLVFHLDEEEAGGGGGRASDGAVTRSKYRGDGVGGDAAGAGFDEGADEIADHVVEETGAGDAVDEEFFVLFPSGLVDGPGGRG